MNTLILMTATGAENLGDELITLCEIRRFREGNPAVRIILFSHDPSRTWRFFRSQNLSDKNLEILPYFPTNIRKNPLKNIGYFFKTLRSFWLSSHIYIGGGGLLYSVSEEGHSPLRLWWMRAGLAKMLGKPVTYLSLGVSAKESEMRRYARGIFANTTITVRDRESQKKVLGLGYASKILSDPVFEYSIKKDSISEKKDGMFAVAKGKILGIALRSGFIHDDILMVTIKTLLQKNYTIYLLPHSLHPENIEAHDGYYLQKFLLPGVKITQTIEQTLAAYPLCDIVIGMRLHSIILASVMKIPLLAISYSAKTKAILTETHHAYLDAEDVTSEALISEVENLAHNLS